MVCKSTLIELGFTRKMIEILCPEPDDEAYNPRFACAAPMKLWNAERIDQIMASSEFKKLKSQADKRREASAKGNATKLAKTRKMVDEHIADIEVHRLDFKLVEEEALLDKQAFDCSRGHYDSDPFHAPQSDQQRWIVNYIRHNLTSYDHDLYETKGQVGTHQEYSRYKQAVLEVIARQYPEVANACQAQIDRLHLPPY